MAETLLAFDFGEKRIGVAVGNNLLRQARALTTLHAASGAARFEAIAKLISVWQPQRLVVGIPYASDGSAHAMTARCVRFANQLHGRFDLPVERVDERYSSSSAQSMRRDHLADGGRDAVKTVIGIDPLAAQIILQSYFDTQHAQQSSNQAA